MQKANQANDTAKELTKDQILNDYRTAWLSRHASVIGRKEVLTGKAKFGIFGDGKEVAQIALARACQNGDWRSGYYRDQTWMFALDVIDVKKFFAQLYADTDLENEPSSGGRQMNSHFATRYYDNGEWKNQTTQFNSSADASPTASQMGRLLGLGYASKIYRENPNLSSMTTFSKNGNEVAIGTIGNASAAEGIFWETLNAAGVLQVPIAFVVWDDGYGISVPNKYQMTKESISDVCQGFIAEDNKSGFSLYKISGWDFESLLDGFSKGIDKIRTTHQPAIFHIVDMTQPQGHSTSGSHERYKSKERMQFETDYDCILRFKNWIIESQIADINELESIEQTALSDVERAQQSAWQQYLSPIESDRNSLVELLTQVQELNQTDFIPQEIESLKSTPALFRRTVASCARRVRMKMRAKGLDYQTLESFIQKYQATNQTRYSKYWINEGPNSALNVEEVPAVFSGKKIPGAEVINEYFHTLFAKDPRVFAIGEDIGQLGGVNQAFKGIQEKFGEIRITDTGIREASIFGQGLGCAMRGLRPIVDIQYLDYLLYCYQLLSDDLASLHYRTAGGQIAPCIIRTKGHRLEGIWHTGSPLGMLIHGVRGVHVCVPRDMVKAAGMYNTLLKSNDPAVVIEVLNGYRLREPLPENLGDFTVPLGMPEVLKAGSDITLVTYGACVRIATEAAEQLDQLGISVEIIDVQTLLPFDRNNVIGASVEKTGALLVVDEDVPGGASAYIMQNILETQHAYDCLDAAPKTLTAQNHRGAYASDGDYWAKPNSDDIVEISYKIMHERAPYRWN